MTLLWLLTYRPGVALVTVTLIVQVAAPAERLAPVTVIAPPTPPYYTVTNTEALGQVLVAPDVLAQTMHQQHGAMDRSTNRPLAQMQRQLVEGVQRLHWRQCRHATQRGRLGLARGTLLVAATNGCCATGGNQDLVRFNHFDVVLIPKRSGHFADDFADQVDSNTHVRRKDAGNLLGQ